MSKMWIGIDNGVTGSIGILSENYSDYCLTPVFKEQNYTKSKDLINRLAVKEFKSILINALYKSDAKPEEVMVALERPMLNPQRWKASISAIRCLEAQLCIIEDLGLPRMYLDSKEWQKSLLPHGIVGSDEQKKASHDIGIRLFPRFKEMIDKHKDADGILIAEYIKRKGL